MLDTFAGSGSTGVACHNLQRQYILVERDSEMFAKMKDRIDKKTEQVSTFTNIFEEV
jgi:DNA modification methylase